MASSVELKAFSVGSWDNNVYIMIDPDSGESVLFDAPTDADRILSALEGTKLRSILFTHADGDHIQALDEIRKATGAPVGIHPAETDRLPSAPNFELSDGQMIDFGSKQLTAFHTPGHSPGGMS